MDGGDEEAPATLRGEAKNGSSNLRTSRRRGAGEPAEDDMAKLTGVVYSESLNKTPLTQDFRYKPALTPPPPPVLEVIVSLL